MKRYKATIVCPECGIEEALDGEWVRHAAVDDYDALRERVARLSSALNDAVHWLDWVRRHRLKNENDEITVDRIVTDGKALADLHREH